MEPMLEPIDDLAKPPSHSLEEALRTMRFDVLPGRFALVGFPEPASAADVELLLRHEPGQWVREGGETTLLLAMEQLPEVLARHPQAAVEAGQVWIRFRGAMAWDLVGFLALVTSRLAAAGVPVGAVCGFSRDSLFLAEGRLEDARAVLRELFPEAR